MIILGSEMLSDDEIRSILDPEAETPKVSMLNPLTIELSASDLESLLRKALTNELDSKRPVGISVVDVRERQRCVDLLAWLALQTGAVAISLYPASEDGLEDLDTLEAEEGTSDAEDLPF